MKVYLHVERNLSPPIKRLKNKRVLEIGIGKYAPLYEQMKKIGKGLYVGIDINPHAIEENKNKVKSSKSLSSSIIIGDALGENLPFADMVFDEIHLHMFSPWIGVTHGAEVRPYPYLLRECYRVLNDNGRFYISADDTFFIGEADYEGLLNELILLFGKGNVNLKCKLNKNDMPLCVTHPEVYIELSMYSDFACITKFYAVAYKRRKFITLYPYHSQTVESCLQY